MSATLTRRSHHDSASERGRGCREGKSRGENQNVTEEWKGGGRESRRGRGRLGSCIHASSDLCSAHASFLRFLKTSLKGASKFICFTETLATTKHDIFVLHLPASHFKTTLIHNIVTFQTQGTLITLFRAHMSSAAMTNGGRERFIYLLCVKATSMRPWSCCSTVSIVQPQQLTFHRLPISAKGKRLPSLYCHSKDKTHYIYKESNYHSQIELKGRLWKTMQHLCDSLPSLFAVPKPIQLNQHVKTVTALRHCGKAFCLKISTWNSNLFHRV